jgi:hypothetical protein
MAQIPVKSIAMSRRALTNRQPARRLSCGMIDDSPAYKLRSMDRALAELRDKHDRTPENSRITRSELQRMIQGLETELAWRAVRGDGARMRDQPAQKINLY